MVFECNLCYSCKNHYGESRYVIAMYERESALWPCTYLHYYINWEIIVPNITTIKIGSGNIFNYVYQTLSPCTRSPFCTQGVARGPCNWKKVISVRKMVYLYQHLESSVSSDEKFHANIKILYYILVNILF